MLYLYRKNKLFKAPTLRDAAGLTGVKCPVVSVAGAGGKTTTIRCLAREYVRAGGQVVVTTTTHMRMEELPWFLLEPTADAIREKLSRYGQVWTGLPAEPGKMKGIPEQLFKELWKQKLPVLIEADGAKCLPLKVPAEHEPVIPDKTTHVFYVFGLDAVGCRIADVCFRYERAADLLDKNITDCITAHDIAFLACSEQAGRKGCPADAEYTVVLNKADDKARMDTALAICKMIESMGDTRVIVSNHKET